MSSYVLELPKEFGDRIDYKYHNPETIEKFNQLRNTKLNGRILIQLRKVAKVKGGKRLPKGTVFNSGERDIIPYIRVNDIYDNSVDVINCAKIPPEIHEQIKNYQTKKGDVLLTIVGATIGKTGIIKETVDICNFTENIAKISITQDDVSNKFILHFLNSNLGKIQTDRYSVGSTQCKLSLANCRKLEIFLPYTQKKYDELEQKRILGEFDKYEKLADKKIEEYKTKIKQYKQYFIELLKISIPKEDGKEETFEYELSDDSEDRIDVLFNNPKRDKLLKNIKKYPHYKLIKLAEIQELGQLVPTAFYNLVGLNDISADLGEIINIQEVPELKSSKMVLRKGEILFSKLQPEKGKIILVDEKHEGYVGSTELVPLKIISEKIVDKFLYHILRSPYVLKQWEYSIRGCSRERVGKPEIYDTLIPLPNRDVQLRAVEKLDKLIVEAKALLKEHKELKEKAKEVFLRELLQQ